MMPQRKPPYRHPVTGHYRAGKYIDRYERGKGKKPVSNSLGQMKKSTPIQGFKATLYYGDGSESISVDAGTYGEAIMMVFAETTGKGVPSRVKIRRVKG